MKKSEAIKHISQILGPEFQIDFFSRLRGEIIFRSDTSHLPDVEMSRIISGLMRFGYLPKFRQKNGRTFIHVVNNEPEQIKTKYWLHIGLFVVTIYTTMLSGALLQGYNIYSDFFLFIHGWQYSFAILSILLAHEFGHYFAARNNGVDATLPYFIPIHIPGINPGTMGAFIKIRSKIPTRKALFDIGAAGPYAGLIVSLLFLSIGFFRLPDAAGIQEIVNRIHGPDTGNAVVEITLGNSFIFSFFNDFLNGGDLPMSEVYHFPFIFAGWVGLLVTAINLIPIGQLDGGHILFSLLGKRAKNVGIFIFAMLIILNAVLIVEFQSYVWVAWVVLILVLIGFRHPPTGKMEELDTNRKILGWLALVVFVLCFSPLPIYIPT